MKFIVVVTLIIAVSMVEGALGPVSSFGTIPGGIAASGTVWAAAGANETASTSVVQASTDTAVEVNERNVLSLLQGIVLTQLVGFIKTIGAFVTFVNDQRTSGPTTVRFLLESNIDFLKKIVKEIIDYNESIKKTGAAIGIDLQL